MIQTILMSTLPVFIMLVIGFMGYLKVPWAKSRYALAAMWVLLVPVFAYTLMDGGFTTVPKWITPWTFLDYMVAFILPTAVFAMLWYKQPASRRRTLKLWVLFVALGTATVSFWGPVHH